MIKKKKKVHTPLSKFFWSELVNSDNLFGGNCSKLTKLDVLRSPSPFWLLLFEFVCVLKWLFNIFIKRFVVLLVLWSVLSLYPTFSLLSSLSFEYLRYPELLSSSWLELLVGEWPLNLWLPLLPPDRLSPPGPPPTCNHNYQLYII